MLLVLAVVLAAVLVWALTGGARRAWERTKRIRAERHSGFVRRYAKENNLPFWLVMSIVHAESGGNPRAVSRVGAKGLMQLMRPAEEDVLRLRRYAPGDLFNPDYNVRIGAGYLGILAKRFHRDWPLVVAAYHMGPGAADRLRREHPGVPSRKLVETYAPPATRAYCRKVLPRR